MVTLKSHRLRKAAERGFKEWRRIFRSVTVFNEHTLWRDLPDAVILFLCEESLETRHGFYDLIMAVNQLGNVHEFESQAFDLLEVLLNGYFFITDQARFECMRRLGWLDSIPREGTPIIEVVMDSTNYEYASIFETPSPTRAHPGFEEDMQSRGIDRTAIVRKHTPEAIRLFRERVESESMTGQ